MSGPLAGKAVVLTGASAGIGAELGEAMLAAGAEVVLAARRLERIEARFGDWPGAHPVRCDVSREEDREQLMATAVERLGRIDGLVNNAGISYPSAATHETLDQFRHQLEINLLAPFALAKLAVAEMRKAGGGAIVNVASVLGVRSVSQMPEAGYAASKAGVIGLTRELASQWGRFGVRVNALAPGFFPSEMTSGLFDDDGDAPEWLRAGTPLGRGGRSGELNEALLFLLGPGSAYVSGHTLVVDGGMATR